MTQILHQVKILLNIIYECKIQEILRDRSQILLKLFEQFNHCKLIDNL